MPGNPLEKNILDKISDIESKVLEIERKTTTDLVVGSDKRIYLDGVARSSYIVWNSASSRIEFYVSGVLEGFINSDNTGTRLENV